MHELTIAGNIIDIIKENAKKSKFSKVLEIRLKVGALRAIDPVALDFCFGVIGKGTIVDGARLIIEKIPIRGSCQDCGGEFQVYDFFFACPKCNGRKVKTIQGEELKIMDMEVE